jgi:nicotinamidase-related amidase
MDRRQFALAGALGLAAGCRGSAVAAAQERKGRRRMLELTTRLREPEGGGYAVREKAARWEPGQSAVVVCDMWDIHWCKGASQRVGEVAPTMNRFLEAARDRGALIVHSPSSCMEPYKDHSGRLRAIQAPTAVNLPKEIGQWCHRIPAEEKGEYPIDQSDGGCDCTPRCEGGKPWRRQIDVLKIHDVDAISDSGSEIWNLFEQRGIRNVMVLGVHTNMCVLGRPFGLRNMARYGKNAVLVRDLTDTMYNSRAKPYVNHFRGTDLIVEHIEKFVCPTITSNQLLGGKPFRFREDPQRG